MCQKNSIFEFVRILNSFTIYHYFEEVNHKILLSLFTKYVKDKKILNLIRIILENFSSKKIGVGMPLGNLTSQFFANVYLNELDHFVKQKLKAKYYIRYVDDFIILDSSKNKLKEYNFEIEIFLKNKLNLLLHPQKTQIKNLNFGIDFLGVRIFPNFKLLRKKNLRKFNRKFDLQINNFRNNLIYYDEIYNFLEGWCAYAKQTNSFNLRKKILSNSIFSINISSKEVNRLL